MKKVALVTGGSRGIGLGIAQKLAQNGFDLVINGIRDENFVQDVLENLRELGAKVIYCQGDIASTEDRESMLEKIKKGEKTKNVPVLVFSNLSSDADISRAKDLGAHEFIIKSNFTLDEVANKINSIIGK